MTSRIDDSLARLMHQVARLGAFIYRMTFPFRRIFQPLLALLQWLHP